MFTFLVCLKHRQAKQTGITPFYKVILTFIRVCIHIFVNKWFFLPERLMALIPKHLTFYFRFYTNLLIFRKKTQFFIPQIEFLIASLP